MAEEINIPAFEFVLPDNSISIKCQTPDEFQEWHQGEWNKWNWIFNAKPFGGNYQQQAQHINGQINQCVQKWRQYLGNKQQLENIFAQIAKICELDTAVFGIF